MAWVLLQKLPFDVILYINIHLLEIKQKEKMLIIDRNKHLVSKVMNIYNESSSRISSNYIYYSPRISSNYIYYSPRISSLTSLSYYETDYESDYERKKRQDKLSKILFGHLVHLELPKQKVYKKEKKLSNKTINRGLKR